MTRIAISPRFATNSFISSSRLPRIDVRTFLFRPWQGRGNAPKTLSDPRTRIYWIDDVVDTVIRATGVNRFNPVDVCIQQVAEYRVSFAVGVEVRKLLAIVELDATIDRHFRKFGSRPTQW